MGKFLRDDRELEGYTVVHLVEALCYKPEGRGFDHLVKAYVCVYLILVTDQLNAQILVL